MGKQIDRYAVSYISFFENVLDTVIVDATSQMEALNKGVLQIMKHQNPDWDLDESGYEDCDTMEEAYELAFNGDSMLNCVKIPD